MHLRGPTSNAPDSDEEELRSSDLRGAEGQGSEVIDIGWGDQTNSHGHRNDDGVEGEAPEEGTRRAPHPDAAAHQPKGPKPPEDARLRQPEHAQPQEGADAPEGHLPGLQHQKEPQVPHPLEGLALVVKVHRRFPLKGIVPLLAAGGCRRLRLLPEDHGPERPERLRRGRRGDPVEMPEHRGNVGATGSAADGGLVGREGGLHERPDNFHESAAKEPPETARELEGPLGRHLKGPRLLGDPNEEVVVGPKDRVKPFGAGSAV